MATTPEVDPVTINTLPADTVTTNLSASVDTPPNTPTKSPEEVSVPRYLCTQSRGDEVGTTTANHHAKNAPLMTVASAQAAAIARPVMIGVVGVAMAKPALVGRPVTIRIAGVTTANPAPDEETDTIKNIESLPRTGPKKSMRIQALSGLSGTVKVMSGISCTILLIMVRTLMGILMLLDGRGVRGSDVLAPKPSLES